VGIKLNAGIDDRNNDDGATPMIMIIMMGMAMMLGSGGCRRDYDDKVPDSTFRSPSRAAQSADLYYCHVYGQIGIEIETRAMVQLTVHCTFYKQLKVFGIEWLHIDMPANV